MTELDAAAEEFETAQREVWQSLLLAASYIQLLARKDAVAAHLDEVVRAAFDRLTVSKINVRTIQEDHRG